MAIRNIREMGDEILRKKSREVTEMTPKIQELINDMYDTLYEAMGVGLAAPQVGILKQIVVIDVEGGEPYTLINPKILETRDTQTGSEGCLSVPGKAGTVTRPAYVRVEALDENMKPFVLEAEDILARAVCHELDHLEGILYVDRAEGELYDVELDDEEE